MFDEPLAFEGAKITLDGVEIDATVGPVRQEPLDQFDGALVARMKVVGAAADLPTVDGERVDIGGDEWEVESSTVFSTTAVVTFVRYLG